MCECMTKDRPTAANGRPLLNAEEFDILKGMWIDHRTASKKCRIVIGGVCYKCHENPCVCENVGE